MFKTRLGSAVGNFFHVKKRLKSGRNGDTNTFTDERKS